MNLPLAPVLTGVIGVVALAASAIPMPILEALVTASGIPAVLAAAEPPLGFTARAMIALGSGGLAALFGGIGLFAFMGSRSVRVGRAAGDAFPDPDTAPPPVIRRADAHPDAPPRPPLLATRDLGAPFRDPIPAPALDATTATAPVCPVERPLPTDLDQPLSAFDPDAVPDAPLPAPVAPPPLRRAPRPPIFDDTERFETFELTPALRPRPTLVVEPAAQAREEAITRPETEATVHALLDRLERGMAGKATHPKEPTPAPIPISTPRVERRAKPRGLEDTLVTLRNLAQRA